MLDAPLMLSAVTQLNCELGDWGKTSAQHYTGDFDLRKRCNCVQPRHFCLALGRYIESNFGELFVEKSIVEIYQPD